MAMMNGLRAAVRTHLQPQRATRAGLISFSKSLNGKSGYTLNINVQRVCSFQPTSSLFNQTQKRLFHSQAVLYDHYSVLGLSKNASDKDIKVAYYKTARIYHPDALKGSNSSPQELAFAKKKWQDAANAYEVLSDPIKRKRYDENLATQGSGGGGGFWGQQQQQSSSQQHQANANQQWDTVTNDADIIEEAIREYAEELKEDAELAAEGMAKGDFGEVNDS
jgi:DnaJ-class molecular chaperone